MNTKAKTRAERRVRETDTAAGLNDRLAETSKQIASLRHMVDEVAEDNMALLEAVKRSAEGQDAIRSAVVREMDQLRSQIAGELQFHWLRNCCRELAPVLHAMERMAAGADFSDAVTTRQHVESLATSLEGLLGRLGVERLLVRPGQDLFDANFHECVKVCAGAEPPLPEAAPRTVVYVQEPGYLVQGRLAIAAKVWVRKNEEPKSEPEKEPAL